MNYGSNTSLNRAMKQSQYIDYPNERNYDYQRKNYFLFSFINSKFIAVLPIEDSRMKTGELKVRNYVRMIEKDPKLNSTMAVNSSVEQRIQGKVLI